MFISVSHVNCLAKESFTYVCLLSLTRSSKKLHILTINITENVIDTTL